MKPRKFEFSTSVWGLAFSIGIFFAGGKAGFAQTRPKTNVVAVYNPPIATFVTNANGVDMASLRRVAGIASYPYLLSGRIGRGLSHGDPKQYKPLISYLSLRGSNPFLDARTMSSQLAQLDYLERSPDPAVGSLITNIRPILITSHQLNLFGREYGPTARNSLPSVYGAFFSGLNWAGATIADQQRSESKIIAMGNRRYIVEGEDYHVSDETRRSAAEMRTAFKSYFYGQQDRSQLWNTALMAQRLGYAKMNELWNETLFPKLVQTAGPAVAKPPVIIGRADEGSWFTCGSDEGDLVFGNPATPLTNVVVRITMRTAVDNPWAWFVYLPFLMPGQYVGMLLPNELLATFVTFKGGFSLVSDQCQILDFPIDITKQPSFGVDLGDHYMGGSMKNPDREIIIRVNPELIAKMEHDGRILAAGCADLYPICPKPVTERERVAAAFGKGQVYFGAKDGATYVIYCNLFDVRSTQVAVNMSVETSKGIRTNTVRCNLVGDLKHGAMVFLGDPSTVDQPLESESIISPMQYLGAAPPPPTKSRKPEEPHFLLGLDEVGHAWAETATGVLPLTRLREVVETPK